MESSGERLHRLLAWIGVFGVTRFLSTTPDVCVVGRYPWESFGTLMAFWFSFSCFSFSSFSLRLSLVSCEAHRGVLYRTTCYNGTTGQRTRRLGNGSIVFSSISTGTGLGIHSATHIEGDELVFLLINILH